TLPIDKPLVIGQLVIFAGKRWEVLHVNAEKKLITLKRAFGGRPPKFGGDGQMVHDIVRQEMLHVYQQKAVPIYLDKAAKAIFDEGIECFHILGLDKVNALQTGNTVHILPWLGDRITNTITVLLHGKGLTADCFAGVIDIRHSSIKSFQQAVQTILRQAKPAPSELANGVPNTIVEKHDPVLPKELRDLGYEARFFDVDGAWEWMNKLKH
ncbi:MAG: DEAD/DEAH box helicase, partial [Candidatus Entotheonellia bacterium]